MCYVYLTAKYKAKSIVIFFSYRTLHQLAHTTHFAPTKIHETIIFKTYMLEQATARKLENWTVEIDTYMTSHIKQGPNFASHTKIRTVNPTHSCD